MRVGDRYELGEPIGHGAFGTTYAAIDTESGDGVVVKHLSLTGLDNWKPIQQFEREAKVLRSLEHRGIPRFIDAFDAEREGGHDFYIVSEHIEGDTLGAKIGAGTRWTDAEARALFVSLLETLDYLHSLSPRVIHRDIKPGNIVLRADGSPVLVDFGAVRDMAGRTGDGGMTIVGTAGYMPPEQAMGRAEPRSDLYALAATMVHALTHQHPAELPSDGLRLKFRDQLGVEPGFVDVLVRLLDPEPDRRLESARAVLDALEGRALPERALVPTTSTRMPALSETPRPLVPDIARRITSERAMASSGGHPKIVPLGLGLGTGGIMMLAVLGVVSWVVLIGCVAGLIATLGGWIAHRQGELRHLYRTGKNTEGSILGAQDHGPGLLVEYQYVVDDTTYQGRLRTKDATARRESEQRKPVAVFYDPEDPRRHVGFMTFELRGLEPRPSTK